jgi:hypothetical protein
MAVCNVKKPLICLASFGGLTDKVAPPNSNNLRLDFIGVVQRDARMLIKQVLRRPEYCKVCSISVKADNVQIGGAGRSHGAVESARLAGGVSSFLQTGRI